MAKTIMNNSSGFIKVITRGQDTVRGTRFIMEHVGWRCTIR